MKNQVKKLALAVAAVSMAGPVAVPVVAQEGSLEEIVVTARKREENLQNVGLAVSALNQTEIERMFARLKDWRRVATHSDKLKITYSAAVHLAASLMFWL